MYDAGYAALQIIPSFEGFQGNLERGSSGALIAAGASGGRKFGDSAGRSMTSSFAAHARRAGFLAAGGLVVAGAAVLKIGKDSIAAASDLNESLNAVNVSYGKQAAGVKALGEQAAESLGLSNTEFNSLAVQFSSFANTIAGGEGRKVVGTLDDLTTRASDFASVMNLDVSDAAQLFQSGLAGESEPLRRYGIDLSAATVQAYAYANGIAESGTELTAAQKVQAAYGSLMKQTAKTQGDFTNTSGELANASRILGARWEDAKAKLGTALLPLMKDAVGFVNREGVPAFERFADWFQKDGAPAISGFVDELKPLANSILPAAASALGDVRDAGKAALPYVKDIIDAFNDMPDWAQKAIVLGGAGAVVGGKLGVGSLLTGGSSGSRGLLGVFSKATPMPVFVTNPGFGGVGGLGGRPGATPIVPTGGGPGPKWVPGAVGGSLLTAALTATGFAMVNGDAGNVHPERPGLDTTNVGSQSDLLALERYRAELERTSDLFKTLPVDLQTNIVLHGAPESKRAALDLAKAYDLTKEQRTTLFRTSGIPLSNRQVADLLGLYVQAEQPRRGHVSVDTGDAEARLLRILALMNEVDRRGRNPAAPGVLPGEGASSSRRAAPRLQRRPAVVHLGDGRQLDAYIDERVDTHEDLASERRRAGALR